MRRLRGTPAPPLLGWGLLLAVLAAVSALAFEIDPEPPLLLAGAALAALGVGFAVALVGPGPEPELLADPDTSAATVWLAVSVVLLAVSAVAGFWLTLIAGGMVGIGAGGVVRELRAQRSALERMVADGGD